VLTAGGASKRLLGGGVKPGLHIYYTAKYSAPSGGQLILSLERGLVIFSFPTRIFI